MEATIDESKAVAWAMKVGLLERSMLCPQCAQPMRLKARERYWRCCRKTRHADGKQERFTIFVNSWFSKKKLSFPGVTADVCVVHANTSSPSCAHGQDQREYMWWSWVFPTRASPGEFMCRPCSGIYSKRS
ncbi:hypothetical protein GN958_ATG13365 [Phytophthora infestans]|uniref:Uncharacterized protein n=1 Tax=Phytophthora infestans TaxID=4787 RepID=A0A8S9UEQ2_PHYIN|nr:hypothetical protein GN958_ATG13365 [Phytophthora infestans]